MFGFQDADYLDVCSRECEEIWQICHSNEIQLPPLLELNYNAANFVQQVLDVE